jgi:quercetin dioxygenase-like cupin family protein
MRPIVVAPGEGRFIAVGSAGTGVTVKAAAAETGGLCTVWEGRVPPGAVGAGPHYHRGRDEAFYVLVGELVLRVGDEQHVARAGTFAFVPRNTIHGFHNASADEATILVMHHPAGFEQFLEGMQELAARRGSKEEREALAARFDMIPAPAISAKP